MDTAEAAQSVNLTGWVIDEAGDLPGTGPVALCGADLDPGSVQRNPVECMVPPDEVARITRARAGVRAAQRMFLTALQAPLEGHVSLHCAVHDTDPGQTAQRLEAGAPQPVLKRRLRHGCYARSQEQFQDAEEGRQRLSRQFIGHRRPRRGIQAWRAPSLP